MSSSQENTTPAVPSSSGGSGIKLRIKKPSSLPVNTENGDQVLVSSNQNTHQTPANSKTRTPLPSAPNQSADANRRKRKMTDTSELPATDMDDDEENVPLAVVASSSKVSTSDLKRQKTKGTAKSMDIQEEDQQNTAQAIPTTPHTSTKANGHQTVADQTLASNDDVPSPVFKNLRFARGNPVTIVLNGDPSNLPNDATFTYSFNGTFNKISSRPMRSTTSLTKRKTKQNKHLLSFVLVDEERNPYKFVYPDMANADWDNEDWVEGANVWFHSIMERCFDVEELPAEGEKATNDQWSTMEITTLKGLVLTQMRRTRGALAEKDWRLVAAHLNLAFKGTTQPEGTVLASARGQPLSIEKPFAVTKEDRVLKGRSAKSLCAVMNRFLGKKLSEWQSEMLKEAEMLGWLGEDETSNRYKVVFRVECDPYEVEGRLFYYEYETKNGEKVEVTYDDQGNLVCGGSGQKVLALDEESEDETEEDSEMGAEDGKLRRQQEIDDEAQRLLADGETSEAMTAISAVNVKDEYERILGKGEMRKMKVVEDDAEAADVEMDDAEAEEEN